MSDLSKFIEEQSVSDPDFAVRLDELDVEFELAREPASVTAENVHQIIQAAYAMKPRAGLTERPSQRGRPRKWWVDQQKVKA